VRQILILALLIGLPAPSRAESGSARAKAHYDRGTEAYERHDYELAIEEFQKSLAAAERAATCYSLGLAGEAAHRADVAVMGFRRYLLLAPMGPVQLHDHAAAFVTEFDLRTQRARAIERDREIEHERLLSTVAAAPAVPKTPRTAWAALSLLVTSLSTSIAGGVVLGHSTTIDPNTPGITLDRHNALIGQASNEQIAGTSLLAIGGAALVSSAACFGAWMHRSHRSAKELRVSVAPIGGAFVTMGGTF
jgi:hypothetical protein